MLLKITVPCVTIENRGISRSDQALKVIDTSIKNGIAGRISGTQLSRAISVPIFDHFDFLAPIYDHVFTSSISDELCDMLAPDEGNVILDAGGGTGRIASGLKGERIKIVVADFSQQMLRQAGMKERLLPVRSRVEKLPFNSGTFDRIMMVDALHHVFDQAATARELWRLLKPGGRIVIEEPDINNLAVKVVALGEKVTGMRSHFLRQQQIGDLFSGCGGIVRMKKHRHNTWVVVDKT
jgi:2-polyprenyl-3-methyl-5-hydroxy-6-metoxy-1,4-benzoquinol methylase